MHRWLHHCIHKTSNKSPKYYWTPTSHSAYQNIPGGMVKNEGPYLSQYVRPTPWTPQSMFTVTLTFILWDLPFPYPLHNRICTRGLEKSINVTLEKKIKGIPTPNKITICLMEEYFKFSIKILARYLIQCAEIGDNFPKEQYGNKK